MSVQCASPTFRGAGNRNCTMVYENRRQIRYSSAPAEAEGFIHKLRLGRHRSSWPLWPCFIGLCWLSRSMPRDFFHHPGLLVSAIATVPNVASVLAPPAPAAGLCGEEDQYQAPSHLGRGPRTNNLNRSDKAVNERASSMGAASASCIRSSSSSREAPEPRRLRRLAGGK